MAFQTKGRDPIFDSATQALIERRGMELLGIGLLALAVVIALVLGSYTPDDPDWLSATEGPAQNLLGRLGANIASPLAVIIGKGAWAIVIALAVWGFRFVIHQGEERAMARAVFVPIAIALASIYASTLVPGANWGHTFGLGGMFGDTALGMVLGVLPVDAATGIKALALISGLAMLAVGAFSLGFTTPEMRRLVGFLAAGVVFTYAGILSALRLGAHGAAKGASVGATGALKGAAALRARQAQGRAERAAFEQEDDGPLAFEDENAFSAPPPLRAATVRRAEPPVERPQPQKLQINPHATLADPAAQPQQQPRQGLLARVQGLAKRTPSATMQPELVDPGTYQGEVPEGAGSSDRISAKIATALRSRRSPGQAPMPEPMAEPAEPLSPMAAAIAKAAAKARARQDETGGKVLRAEPPVMRGAVPPAPAHVPMPIEPPLEEANIFADVADPGAQLLDHESPTDPLEWDDGIGANFEPDYEADFAAPAPAPAPAMAPTPAPKKVVQHISRRVATSTRAKAEAQPQLNFEDNSEAYELPPLGLLTDPASIPRHHLSDEALEENARMLETVLDD
ncbi:MAG TPA: hypothetical protein ENK63_04600, partial [Rhodobacterales bacterium]|nr:hypothetical protein [Rhodobacterales bacterium]